WKHVRIDPGNTAVTPLDFTHYPWSHSLLTCAGWSILFAPVYYARTRYRRGAVGPGLGVMCHRFLDLLTHRPDLPLHPGAESAKVGLGLWSSIPATLAVELAMFFVGIFLYTRATKARDRIGSWGFALLMLTLLGIYFGNIFGPPP